MMRTATRWFFLSALIFASLSISLGIGAVSTHADTASSSVQAQIDQNNQQINSIEQEIANYQKQLNVLGTQKQTLQSNIKSIDVSKQKTSTQIQLTQTQIQVADLNLQKLGSQILTKQQQIDLDKQTLAAAVRQINTDDQTPFIVSFFSSDNLLQIWNEVDNTIQVTEALKRHTESLMQDTVQLAGQQQQVASTKNQLTSLATNLQTQKGQLDAQEQTKQQLLAQTKSQESSYQQLIAQKKAQEKLFENQLAALQNSLKGVSASQIPHTGQGILSWPFSDSVMSHCKGLSGALGNPYCITQYFGNTSFATANAAIYSGMGHDGVDIGVPIGTPVEAALAGVVSGTGNTDQVPGCYSFGKWVMVQHSNGLNTMYAHLSVINVTKGQAVSTGDVLGYSGMTGYATGPHLHFGVYATAGVQYLTLGQFHGTKTPCSSASMPVAPPNAYLNPLSYL